MRRLSPNLVCFVSGIDWFGGHGFESRRELDFALLRNVRTGCGPTRPPTDWIPKILPGVKLPESEVNHSSPANVKVRNRWNYTATFPISLQGVEKKNFGFYFLLTYRLTTHNICFKHWVTHTAYTNKPLYVIARNTTTICKWVVNSDYILY
jgi:hypothetical protein